MHLTEELSQNFTMILKEELVAAMGCTEPIAIAYAAALARQTLGCRPQRVEVKASANIIKNVKSVVVPNTGSLRGIAAAAAAGIVAGRADDQLQVLSEVTEDEVKENVKKLYERLDKKTESFMNLLENSGYKDNNLYQTSSNMRNNMQFMQDLNQMAAYIQLPVKFNESKAHGDLYVFNRKGGKPVNKDSISAFLHLDLEHLGATDIDVLLEGKALKTQFSLKDKSSIDLVEAHLHELEDRLTKRGFSVSVSAIQMPADKNENAFLEVLEKDKPQISIKRYSFDVRA
jgi:flagellar hook-length control protein FliK